MTTPSSHAPVDPTWIIDFFRHAIASIATALDRDDPDEKIIEEVGGIADNVLELTKDWPRTKGKDLTLDGVGEEGWIQYKAKYLARVRRILDVDNDVSRRTTDR